MSEENLIKLVENTQHGQKVQAIISGIGTGLSLIATGLVAWKSFKSPQASLAVRMMRKRASIIKLKLELETLEKEAEHEAEITKLGAGAALNKIKDTIADQSQGLKGTDLLNKKTTEVKDKLNEKVNKLKDKFF